VGEVRRWRGWEDSEGTKGDAASLELAWYGRLGLNFT